MLTEELPVLDTVEMLAIERTKATFNTMDLEAIVGRGRPAAIAKFQHLFEGVLIMFFPFMAYQPLTPSLQPPPTLPLGAEPFHIPSKTTFLGR
jgi:hypothetical protein